MSFLTRLFMDPHQRQLTRPEDYKAPLDLAQVKSEVAAKTKDPESRSLMLEALSGFGPQRPLTVAGVVKDAYSLREATASTTDNTMHQYGVEATLGADMVTSFLIRRANQLADGIKPGATAAVGAL